MCDTMDFCTLKHLIWEKMSPSLGGDPNQRPICTNPGEKWQKFAALTFLCTIRCALASFQASSTKRERGRVEQISAARREIVKVCLWRYVNLTWFNNFCGRAQHSRAASMLMRPSRRCKYSRELWCLRHTVPVKSVDYHRLKTNIQLG